MFSSDVHQFDHHFTFSPVHDTPFELYLDTLIANIVSLNGYVNHQTPKLYYQWALVYFPYIFEPLTNMCAVSHSGT
jgi:hypothetical protein